MLEGFHPNRYAVIEEKNRREIVMLRGTGCSWKRCRFCDYHLDCDPVEAENYRLNREQLNKVTGIYGKLEVINSGSFVDLDNATMEAILAVCEKKSLFEVHFENHWRHREKNDPLRNRFRACGTAVKIKTGVETFDKRFRESYLDKGIDAEDPAEIAAYFDECCLLQGLPGQTRHTMDRDIRIGLQYFERVCVNIMQENGCPVKPDPTVIGEFLEAVYPLYRDNPRVDILLENTAFGVGGVTTCEQ